jgi:hypothetical protein
MRWQIVHAKSLAKVVNAMPTLKELWCTDNPFFKKNVPESRVALLSRIRGSARQGFSLLLNGEAVGVEERIDAVRVHKMPIGVKVMVRAGDGGDGFGGDGGAGVGAGTGVGGTAPPTPRDGAGNPFLRKGAGRTIMNAGGGTPRRPDGRRLPPLSMVAQVVEQPFDEELLRRLRLALVLEQLHVSESSPRLLLGNKNLDYIGDLVRDLFSRCCRCCLRLRVSLSVPCCCWLYQRPHPSPCVFL